MRRPHENGTQKRQNAARVFQNHENDGQKDQNQGKTHERSIKLTGYRGLPVTVRLTVVRKAYRLP